MFNLILYGTKIYILTTLKIYCYSHKTIFVRYYPYVSPLELYVYFDFKYVIRWFNNPTIKSKLELKLNLINNTIFMSTFDFPAAFSSYLAAIPTKKFSLSNVGFYFFLNDDIVVLLAKNACNKLSSLWHEKRGPCL